MIKIKTRNYERITKAQARKRYELGEDIYLVPCKCSPDNVWGLTFQMNKDNINTDGFDKTVNCFIWYNCNHNELGYYPAFYIKRED